MSDRSYQEWIDLHWQRALTPEEVRQWETYLSGHPEIAAEWEWDKQLLEGVRSLNDVPLSNNFTSRVIRSIEPFVPNQDHPRAASALSKHSWWAEFWGRPGIRVAGVSLVMLVGYGLWQWDPSSPNLVESVTTVTQAETVPTFEELENFDAIQGLAQTTPEVDWELVFAMD